MSLLLAVALLVQQPVVVAVDQLAVVRKERDQWIAVTPEWSAENRQLSFARTTVGGTGATAQIRLWSTKRRPEFAHVVYCGEGPREAVAEVWVSGGMVSVPRSVTRRVGEKWLDPEKDWLPKPLPDAGETMKSAEVIEADFDGDGRTDRLVALTTTLGSYVGYRDGQDSRPIVLDEARSEKGAAEAPRTDVAAVADFDGDGSLEIALSRRDATSHTSIVCGLVNGKITELGRVAVGL